MTHAPLHGLLVFFVGLALVGSTACPGDGDADADADAGDADVDAGDADAGLERPPLACVEPISLGGDPWFTDITDELGLGPAGLGVQGGRISTTDLDGDRWPDLVVNRYGRGDRRDDPAAPTWFARVLRNDGDGGFEDVTMSSGLSDTRDGSWGRASMFIIFGDIDGDGDVDAFSATNVPSDIEPVGDHSEIYLNEGDGTFVLGPEGDFSDARDIDPVVSATFVDYDLDGNLDLFVGEHYGQYGLLTSAVQDSLYQGQGNGEFVDVSDEAGVATDSVNPGSLAEGTNHRPTWGVGACDFDADGWPELTSVSYGRQLNLLWHALGDGTYEDIAAEVGFQADENLDYSDNNFYRCHCHAFGGDCEPMPEPPNISCGTDDYWSASDSEPWRLGGNSAATVCGDLDNDGDLDALAVELRHWHIGQSSDMTELLFNEGVGTGGRFTRPGNEQTGLVREHVPSWNEGDLGGALFDFDNDGRLDVLVASSDYPATYSLLWRQVRPGEFHEYGELAGVRLDRAHGATLADIDRDGDYDLILGTSLMRWSADDIPPRPDGQWIYVFRNDVGQSSNRVMLHLEGAGAPGANRSAIGARIEVRVGDEVFVREVQGGYGVEAFQHDPFQIIGVGEHCEVDEVVVRWPNAEHTVTTIPQVPANYVLVVHETEGVEFMTLDEYVGR